MGGCRAVHRRERAEGQLAFGIGSGVTILLAGIQIGPIGAFMSELFHTRYRYTATGFSYNVALVIGGAVPPVVGAAITARFGGFVFGMFLAAFCLVSLVCTLVLPETREYDLNRSGLSEETQ